MHNSFEESTPMIATLRLMAIAQRVLSDNKKSLFPSAERELRAYIAKAVKDDGSLDESDLDKAIERITEILREAVEQHTDGKSEVGPSIIRELIRKHGRLIPRKRRRPIFPFRR